MKYSKMFIIFMVLSIFVLEAQEKKEKDASFFLSPSLSTWGLNTIIGYRFSNFMSDNMNTAVFTGWGGGYLGGYYYRLPDGTVFSHPVDSFSEDAVRFSYWTTLWQVGVRQGLFSKGWHDYLGIDVRYQGKWRSHIQSNSLLDASFIGEKEKILQHEFKIALFTDFVVSHWCHRYLEGIAAMVWYRTVPVGMGKTSLGDFSFSAFGADTMAMFTLWESNRSSNDLCFILAMHGGIEGIWGGMVPFYERGIMKKYLRGVDGHGLDIPFSAVGNMEIRLYLPAMGNMFNLIMWPVLYAFSDNGCFWNESVTKDLFVSSAGIGFALEWAPFFVVTFSTQWRLTGTNVDGGNWVPFSLCIGSYLFGSGYPLIP